MKILVLVQSIDEGGYSDLIRVQKETWGSVKHPDVRTLFYMPHPKKSGIEGDNLYVQAGPHWGLMYLHLMKAFTHALTLEWDYIFKTDNSAYVNKPELVKILQDKPREKFYGGHLFSGGTKPDVVNDFMWGEGYALSRDVVEKLVDEYAIKPYEKLGADDTILGFRLKDKFPWDGTMKIQHYYDVNPVPPAHVYRCANDGENAVKFEDEMKNMRDIHQQLTR